MNILLDVTRDEHNADAEAEVATLRDRVDWPAVPRVGDLISLPSGRTLRVTTVFWNWPAGTVVVRGR